MGAPAHSEHHATALIERAAQGDAAAFEALVDPLTMRLLLFLRRRGRGVLGSDCDEEDLLQKVLLRAWTALPSFSYAGPGSFHRWLVAIARGIVRDRYQYQQAKGRGDVRQWDTRAGASAFVPATSVSKVVARKEEFELACGVLDGLDDRQREVVEAYLLDAKSLSQIARDLGVTKNAVWERLHRGLGKLRTALKGAA